MENTFITSVRYQYLEGILSREAAIRSVMHYDSTLSMEQAGDVLDGEILASGRRFQAIFSMAKVHPDWYPPDYISGLLAGYDAWFGDESVPKRKAACLINVMGWNFYFCFGKPRGVKYSLGESLANEKWEFRALVVHGGGHWYYRKNFSASDFKEVRDLVYGLGKSDTLGSMVGSLGLAQDDMASNILGIFD